MANTQNYGKFFKGFQWIYIHIIKDLDSIVGKCTFLEDFEFGTLFGALLHLMKKRMHVPKFIRNLVKSHSISGIVKAFSDLFQNLSYNCGIIFGPKLKNIFSNKSLKVFQIREIFLI